MTCDRIYGTPWRCKACEHLHTDDRLEVCTICGLRRGLNPWTGQPQGYQGEEGR